MTTCLLRATDLRWEERVIKTIFVDFARADLHALAAED